jgi:hypothetical protein
MSEGTSALTEDENEELPEFAWEFCTARSLLRRNKPVTSVARISDTAANRRVGEEREDFMVRLREHDSYRTGKKQRRNQGDDQNTVKSGPFLGEPFTKVRIFRRP